MFAELDTKIRLSLSNCVVLLLTNDKSESKSGKRKRGRRGYIKALEKALAVMVEQMKRKNDLLELEVAMEWKNH
ncbi:hypothetical protein LINPERHAP2_LOCUS16732 [Linum perenne]